MNYVSLNICLTIKQIEPIHCGEIYMKMPFKKTEVVAFFACALLTMTLNVLAQETADPEKHFYDTTKAAPAAFNAGDFAKAEALSFDLLEQAKSRKKNWNHGNAVHTANLVLGRIALKTGKMDEARHFLIEAGKTPGSPQLNTFGPDMVLAKELLEKGEIDTVKKYFALCDKFWDKRFSKTEEWNILAVKGEIPDFGPNLRYVF